MKKQILIVLGILFLSGIYVVAQMAQIGNINEKPIIDAQQLTTALNSQGITDIEAWKEYKLAKMEQNTIFAYQNNKISEDINLCREKGIIDECIAVLDNIVK